MEILKIVLPITILIGFLLFQKPLVLWLKASNAQPRLSIKQILSIPKGMDKSLLVDAYIMVRFAHVDLKFEDLKEIYREDPKNFLEVISALINEKRNNESKSA